MLQRSLANFSAGPAGLFDEVVAKTSESVVEYNGRGISIMELGHRTNDFKQIESEASSLVREILNVPETHEVIWMQGGGTGMFAGVVYNLIKTRDDIIDFIITGKWSQLAYSEAVKLGAKANIVYQISTPHKTAEIPLNSLKFTPNSAYVYYCDNETIDGIQLPAIGKYANNNDWSAHIPQDIPIVCDMSSSIGTAPIDVSKYGVIFAGAQKNLGTSGVTLAIVRRSLMSPERPKYFPCPSILDFAINSKAKSAYNTPPVLQIYVCKLTLEHMKRKGGMSKFYKDSMEKIKIVEDAVDSSNGLYVFVHKFNRSRVNVVLRVCPKKDGVPCPEADSKFIEYCKNNNILGVQGHRSVGGIRISLYNSVSVDKARLIASHMKEFAKI